MPLLTHSDRNALLANGQRQQAVRGTSDEIDFEPVVKLFTPDANATWLLSELDPDCPDIAFGLCDLGLGLPELGSVSIFEIEACRGPLRLRVERDQHFSPSKTLSEYAADAANAGRIVV